MFKEIPDCEIIQIRLQKQIRFRIIKNSCVWGPEHETKYNLPTVSTCWLIVKCTIVTNDLLNSLLHTGNSWSCVKGSVWWFCRRIFKQVSQINIECGVFSSFGTHHNHTGAVKAWGKTMKWGGQKKRKNYCVCTCTYFVKQLDKRWKE